MKVLVTGGSGFIGSHLVDELIAQKHEVSIFDMVDPHRLDVYWFKGSIESSIDVTAACRNVDYVYHLAAVADVNVAHTNPEMCISSNINGTANVLRCATDEEVKRVILASTTWVYGKNDRPLVDEDNPIPQPEHVYTMTKIAQENLVHAWEKQYGLPYTILRYDIPYGPRMRGNMAIATFVKRALRGEKIKIFGKGDQGRCWIHVYDLAKGNVAAMSEFAENKVFNVAGKRFVTIQEIVDLIQQRYNFLEIEHEDARPGDFKGIHTDISSILNAIDWEPLIIFSAGLLDYELEVEKNEGKRTK